MRCPRPAAPAALQPGEAAAEKPGILTVFEAKTGALVYQERLGSAVKESFSASPVAVNGRVFFTNDLGETFVVQTGREFKLIGVNTHGARTLASSALADNTWYWRTEEALLAIR